MKKNTIIRMLCLVIVMAMLISALPTIAWAANDSQLVTTRYSKSVSYTTKIYNPDTGVSEETVVTDWFYIPEIKLSGNTVSTINNEIYNTLYPIITDVVDEVNTYGKPLTSDGITYKWAVNNNILSLVITINRSPEGSGGSQYLVYNINTSTGSLVSDGEVIQASGTDTETEYYEDAKMALGSRVWWGKRSYFFTVQSNVDWFNDRLNKTISNDNIGQAIPYINEDGYLCIIAKVYSLAAGDYYWNDLPLVGYEVHPFYATEATLLNLSNLEGILINHWWENHIQVPLAYRFYADGTAEEYFVDPATDEVNTNYISRKFTYELDEGCLKLTCNGSVTQLELLSSKTGAYFFYESNFVLPAPDIPEQAMYLVQTSRELDSTGASPFADVSASRFYYEPVLWAVENGITNGVDSSHFAPNQKCTRGQVVTFLWRASGCPAPSSRSHPFTDVKASAFYYDAMLWAYENGIVNGTSETSFEPNDTCTRAQVATILYRFLGAPEYSSRTNPFTDVAKSKYYYDAVLWAVDAGVTNGMTATTFAPNSPCTRGQIVTFLHRALG